MRIRKTCLASLIAVAALTPARLAAADSITGPPGSNLARSRPDSSPHFYMGTGASIAVPFATGGAATPVGVGGGFDIFFGGRLHRFIALGVDWQPTFHAAGSDPSGRLGYNLNASTLDLILLPFFGRIQPYVTLGAGIDVLASSGRVIGVGPGWQGGGGIDFWVSRMVTLNLKAQYRATRLEVSDPEIKGGIWAFFGAQASVAIHFPNDW